MPRAARERRPYGVPLASYLARRRRWVAAVFLLIIAFGTLLAVADHRGWLGGYVSDMTRYDGRTFLVTHVVDGDTLDVAEPDGSRTFTRVRFWGVDAPEMDHPGNPKPHEPFALEATEFTRQRTEGKTVRLHLEEQRPRERYGRLLAYIELPDGGSLNEELLAEGLARADTRWVHARLERFKLLEAQAKRDHVGLWGENKKKAKAKPTTQPAGKEN